MVWFRVVPGLLLLLLISQGFAGGDAADPVPMPLALDAAEAEALLDGATVTLHLGAAVHTLAVAPRELMGPEARVVLLSDEGESPTSRPTTQVYAGTLDGLSDWHVRIMRDGSGATNGVVVTPEGSVWVLEPDASGGLTARWVSAVAMEPLGEDGIMAPGEETSEPTAPSAPVLGERDVLRLRVAFEVDHRYYSSNTVDWQDDLVQILAIYDAVLAQLDVQIDFVWAGAWETQDPYTGTHVCTGDWDDDKLVQFSDYWRTYRTDVARDVAHLGALGIQGNTIGCAYIYQTNSPWAYGVSRLLPKVWGSEEVAFLQNAALVAHEIGHNLGGLHERSAGAYGFAQRASSVAPYTIMNPIAVNQVLRYSELDGVYSPLTGWELDNEGAMRAYLETRLSPVE